MTDPLRTLRIEITTPTPERLDKALARDVPEAAALSRSRLARLIADGQVRLGGEPVTDAKRKVAAGDIVEIHLPETVEVEASAEEIPLDVVFEDDALIVVDKPAGMVVHPAPGTPSGTLVNALLHHCGDSLSGIGGARRPGIVHRIDKDTSGLLVVAKTDAAHHGLAAQFEAHSVARRYLGVAHGCPDPADPRLRGIKGTHWEGADVLRISTELARHRHDRQRQAVVWAGGRHAVTRLRVLAPYGRPPAAALVECRLETGRTHQIRVHMAHIGHGLIGDPVYGGRRKLSSRTVGPDAAALAEAFPRQALHAASLGFQHPVCGAQMDFESALPPDMSELVAALEGTPG